ncbi:MAG: Ldh family oxidoreductase, partial [Nitrospinota bacterium]
PVAEPDDPAPAAARIPPEELLRFTSAVLERIGVPSDRARGTAHVLVEADLRGIRSHGVVGGTGLEAILQKVEAGGIHPGARPEVERHENSVLLHMDARGGLGHPAALDAVELVALTASYWGYGKMTIRNSTHFGAAGVYSEALAERGLAGRVTSTGTAWMIPFGGSQKRLGTNPIAWSIPYPGGVITIDMATSQRALSPALKAAQEGGELPPDYLLGPDGEEVRRPGSVEEVKACSVLPVGGRSFGYKGSGLAVLIELDAALGGGSVGRIPSLAPGPEGYVAQTVEAWRVDSLFPREEAMRRLGEAVEDLRRHGGPEMLLPGERERRCREAYRKEGIPFSEAEVRRLREVGERFGVAWRQP